jgi:hypothetical protein
MPSWFQGCWQCEGKWWSKTTKNWTHVMHSMNERLIINLTLNSPLKTCLMFLVSLTCSTNLFFKLRKKAKVYIHAKGFFLGQSIYINIFFVNLFVVSNYVFRFNYFSSNVLGLLQAINHLILAKQTQRLVKTSIHAISHFHQPKVVLWKLWEMMYLQRLLKHGWGKQ